MYDDELIRVRSEINRMANDGLLEGCPIILFGVSDNTRQMIQVALEVGIIPSNIIDNDKSKIGSYCYQVPVKSVKELTKSEIDRGFFFIYSYYWREMSNQLESIGVERHRIISFFPSERTMEEQFQMADEGKIICDRFVKKYGVKRFFLCPYTGTGDIYIIGSYWEEYMKREHFKDYIFIVMSVACAKVTRFFKIRNVEIIRPKERANIIEYYKLCGIMSGITVLNDSWWELRANSLQSFRGLKGLNFSQMFKKFVFDFDDDVSPTQPVLGNVDKEIIDIFNDNELKESGTVVLSPYSNTLSDLPGNFWTYLAGELKKRGYIVCTNCGNEREQPVKGTKKMFISLDMMPQFIEKAGIFIGVRSGLCDCISSAKAKKIILYDKRERFFCSSAYEYFSLEKMGICDDAIELEYDRDLDNLKADILKYIT